MAAQQRQQTPLARARLVPARDERCQVGPMLQEPFQPSLEVGQSIEQLRLERFDGEQRNQADHRAHLER